MMHPRVHVVLLNWNNSADTLECLESLLRIDYPNYQLVVCDNASSDDSLARLRSWARGEVHAPEIAEPLRHIMATPRADPAPFVEIDRETAERGGTPEARAARFLLIRNVENLGFAGGNNVAIRYAVAARKHCQAEREACHAEGCVSHPERSTCHPERSEGSPSMESDPSVAALPQDDNAALPQDDNGALPQDDNGALLQDDNGSLSEHDNARDSYVCLVNNDTVVSRNWMSLMMAAMQSDEKIGAAGATLYEYYAPELVESAGGGVVHPWQGMPRANSAHRQRRGTPAAVPRRLDFLSGACMLMRTSMLERVGLIDERYFIYCEDIDLSLRIRRAGLRIVLVPGAEMWHKNGGIMGTLTARRDYYMARNSLLLVHKLYPAMIPAALVFSLYRCALPKIVRRDRARLRAVAGAYRDFFSFVAGNPLGAGVGTSVPPRT
ncbi:MAG: glycosyl transferase, family 2 [Gemmatimonadetes bacterium]|nr:glycosyl transferase, family 2 [Gemmatimonadota bacterium]